MDRLKFAWIRNSLEHPGIRGCRAANLNSS